jgi:eukaryotic-like serine/threonine-protein kinase
MTDAATEFGTGALVAGKLRIVRVLGEGGMGAVYEVEHVLTKHRRALKVLHPQFASNEQAVARFLREASAAGRIGSEHIVETFDAGMLDTGEPYLVMEMLEGSSLADLLEQKGRLPESEAIEWIAQACDGLQAAHDAGIVHRDIKPDNLFVERTGRVKILDFGISKFDPTMTGEMQLTGDLTLGTPYYMAPEQTSHTASVDQRADIYALGVVLYECVTGQKPFQAETLPQLFVQIHLNEYAPASSIAPSAALLDSLIAKAMARDPELRFQTPAELGRALRELAVHTQRAESPFQAPAPVASLAAIPEPAAVVAEEAPVVEVATPTRVAAGRPATFGLTLPSAGSEPPPAPERQAPAPTRRRRAGVLALSLLIGVALVAWWSRSRAPAGDVRAEPSAGQSATAEFEKPPNGVAAPLVTIAAAEPPPESTPSTRATGPSASSAPRAPVARASATSTSSTRASAHDLEEKNPF